MPPVAFRLLPLRRVASLTLLRSLVAVLFFAAFFGVANMWTRTATHPTMMVIAPHPGADTTSVLDGRARGLHTRSDDWVDPRVDLNGNEIDDAVGDYRVDRRGEM